MFESSVNSDGSQTNLHSEKVHNQFESSVNSDGSQTRQERFCLEYAFECSVNIDFLNHTTI